LGECSPEAMGERTWQYCGVGPVHRALPLPLCSSREGVAHVASRRPRSCAEKGRETMRPRRLTFVVAAVLGTMVLFGGAGIAQAAFPNLSGCRARPESVEEGCIDIQARSGNFSIKGFNVPLHESLEIRGTIRTDTEPMRFIPPLFTNGFFARPEPVPGGLLGIEWIPGNSVLAITELAGSSSDIRINAIPPTIRMPIKVRLVNLLLGMDCHIGNNSNPVWLTLATTRFGTVSQTERGITIFGNVNGESTFAVPGATECGLGLGLINSLVNARLQLPSSSGNNSISITNDIALVHP